MSAESAPASVTRAASRDGDVHCAMCRMIGTADVGALPNGWRPTMNGGALCVRCSEVA